MKSNPRRWWQMVQPQQTGRHYIYLIFIKGFIYQKSISVSMTVYQRLHWQWNMHMGLMCLCVVLFISQSLYEFIQHGLTHWGRVTHICVGNLISSGSYNGLSSAQRQAIIWTNAGSIWTPGNMLIEPLGTNFPEILTEMYIFSFMIYAFVNVVWKMAAVLSRL